MLIMYANYKFELSLQKFINRILRKMSCIKTKLFQLFLKIRPERENLKSLKGNVLCKFLQWNDLQIYYYFSFLKVDTII